MNLSAFNLSGFLMNDFNIFVFILILVSVVSNVQKVIDLVLLFNLFFEKYEILYEFGAK